MAERQSCERDKSFSQKLVEHQWMLDFPVAGGQKKGLQRDARAVLCLLSSTVNRVQEYVRDSWDEFELQFLKLNVFMDIEAKTGELSGRGSDMIFVYPCDLAFIRKWLSGSLDFPPNVSCVLEGDLSHWSHFYMTNTCKSITLQNYLSTCKLDTELNGLCI